MGNRTFLVAPPVASARALPHSHSLSLSLLFKVALGSFSRALAHHARSPCCVLVLARTALLRRLCRLRYLRVASESRVCARSLAHSLALALARAQTPFCRSLTPFFFPFFVVAFFALPATGLAGVFFFLLTFHFVLRHNLRDDLWAARALSLFLFLFRSSRVIFSRPRVHLVAFFVVVVVGLHFLI